MCEDVRACVRGMCVLCVCMRACVRAWNVCVCVRACVRMRVCVWKNVRSEEGVPAECVRACVSVCVCWN